MTPISRTGAPKCRHATPWPNSCATLRAVQPRSIQSQLSRASSPLFSCENWRHSGMRKAAPAPTAASQSRSAGQPRSPRNAAAQLANSRSGRPSGNLMLSGFSHVATSRQVRAACSRSPAGRALSVASR